MRIGYLVPEFPGQTHVFFWREREVLREHGVAAELVSTRRPPAAIVSHRWAERAMSETEYLFPLRGRGAQRVLRSLSGAGLVRVARSIGRAEGVAARGRARLWALAALGAQLAWLGRERGWSHLHVHSCADAAHAALFAHLLSGLPYSLTLHGPLADYGPNQREKWRHAAFAIVITERLMGEVQRQLAGALPAIVRVAPMGVEASAFEPPAARPRHRRGSPLRIFSCGRLNPCKGHDVLLHAVALLRARGTDARLRVAGEDESGGRGYRRELEALVRELGLGGSVELLGAVDEARVASELGEAHVFALASRAEPLGVAIMEAMATEAPVVVTGAGGVPELVRDGVDGLLVPPGEPEALADGIARVAADPELAQRLGCSAAARVRALFHPGRSAEVLAAELGSRAREFAAS